MKHSMRERKVDIDSRSRDRGTSWALHGPTIIIIYIIMIVKYAKRECNGKKYCRGISGLFPCRIFRLCLAFNFNFRLVHSHEIGLVNFLFVLAYRDWSLEEDWLSDPGLAGELTWSSCDRSTACRFAAERSHGREELDFRRWAPPAKKLFGFGSLHKGDCQTPLATKSLVPVAPDPKFVVRRLTAFVLILKTAGRWERL